MSLSTRATALTAAGAVAILGAGAGIGAGIFAAVAPPTTTTTVVEGSASAPAPSLASSTTGMSVNAVYKRTHEGVVDITVDSTSNGSAQPGGSPFNFGGSQETQAEGSGWVLDSKGDIVTNEHVVSGATSIKVTLWNGQTYAGHLVGTDTSTDLAVVRISAPASEVQPIAFGDSDAVQVGDPVVAIGSPFGLPQTVTSGIVSALHRSIDSPSNFTIGDSIQTDAPINHGNSGGPLLNAAGQVIGVNSQIQSESGGSDGVGFAIPSNTVKSVVAQILSGKPISHAYFGVRVQDSTSPLGADLAQILPGTPAAKAGLKAGDVVTKLDGLTVTSQSDLSAVIETKHPGEPMKVTYVRHGKTETVTVTLTARPPTT
ncbi:MAG TPA: trypsin-like peptidase domain-containing protein [Gaiellaceae bacterium]|jgi:putative serine protease PepD|nr:trypsin-like peptidase domain-containing protein [Gaiellaceae bacterium]